MDNAGKYSHALTAVLYAAEKAGCNLGEILKLVKQYIIGNGLRPLPQDQDVVIAAVAQAISDIGAEKRRYGASHFDAIPMPDHPPQGIPDADEMPCPDCKGKQTTADGEACNLCSGTGVTTRY